MDIPDADEAARIWNEVLLACHLFEAALERQAQRDGGLSHGHVQILVLLDANSRRTMTLTTVAVALRYSISRTSHAVATLEKQGLLDRRPLDDDRRSMRVDLTAAGKEIVRKVMEAQQCDIRDPLFEYLGPEGVHFLGQLAHQAVTRLDDTTPSERSPT